MNYCPTLVQFQQPVFVSVPLGLNCPALPHILGFIYVLVWTQQQIFTSFFLHIWLLNIPLVTFSWVCVCFFLFSLQKNKKRRLTFMPTCQMKRPLCSLWPWLRSTARSWASDWSCRGAGPNGNDWKTGFPAARTYGWPLCWREDGRDAGTQEGFGTPSDGRTVCGVAWTHLICIYRGGETDCVLNIDNLGIYLFITKSDFMEWIKG